MAGISAQAEALWADAPAATRCIVIANAATTLVGLVTPGLVRLFQLSLAGVLRLNVLPLCSFWLIGPSGGNPIMDLLMLAMNAWVATSYFAPVEREQGSLRFMSVLSASGACIGLLFLVASALLSAVDGRYAEAPCLGPMPLLLMSVSRRMLELPPGSKTPFFGVFQVPAVLYPLCLIGLFCLLSWRLQVDLLAACAVALALHQGDGGAPPHPAVAPLKLPLEKALPSRSAVENFEQAVVGGGGQRLGGKADGSLAQSFGAALLVLPRLIVRHAPSGLRRCYVSVGGSLSGSQGLEQGNRAAAAAAAASSPNLFGGSGQRLGGAPR
eukprot:TRINITY_DN51979_c0_g1_i1.p1 TRINITY_DN51979_c0_g1~~TRINITY_DN51979_c0_g1_i1.p1  ORF type:complete len:326 (-),score=44.87 TRINITY_DN51979_c0_g1_i1:135-1112(-)